MESIEKEIYDELVHSLHEMGVNRSDHDHSQFRRRAIRDCKSYLSKVSDEQLDYQSLKTQKFPKNYNDAYEHVLRHDDVPVLCYTYTDKLGADGFEPYFRDFDRRNGNFRGYKLKNDFQTLSSIQLDPLKRFVFNQTSAEEVLFDNWFLADEGSSLGIMFEAVLACHVIQSRACHNCKCVNTLRWYGGSGTSWQDLVCIECSVKQHMRSRRKQPWRRLRQQFVSTESRVALSVHGVS